MNTRSLLDLAEHYTPDATSLDNFMTDYIRVVTNLGGEYFQIKPKGTAMDLAILQSPPSTDSEDVFKKYELTMREVTNPGKIDMVDVRRVCVWKYMISSTIPEINSHIVKWIRGYKQSASSWLGVSNKGDVHVKKCMEEWFTHDLLKDIYKIYPNSDMGRYSLEQQVVIPLYEVLEYMKDASKQSPKKALENLHIAVTIIKGVTKP